MELNLTRDDRRFLRSLRIYAEAPDVGLPWPVPDELIRRVTKEFGEFTAATYWAYTTKFGNGDKRK